MIGFARREQHTIAFLRMAAIELRRIADSAPDIAVELRYMARQLDAEADDLAKPNPMTRIPRRQWLRVR